MRKCKCGYILKNDEKFCPIHGDTQVKEISDEIVEILERLNKIEEQLQTPKTIVKAIHRRRKGQRKTSKEKEEEMEKALELYRKGYSCSRALKKAFGYNSKVGGANINEFKKYLEDNGEEYEVKRKKRRTSICQRIGTKVKSPTDGRVIRMRFMSNRRTWLMRNYDYSFERACRVASEEWGRNNTRTIFSGPPLTEEKIIPVIISDINQNKILFQVLKNIIMKHGRITYINDGFSVGINGIQEWKCLLEKIMTNANAICNYFLCENKFKIVTIGSTYVLLYE